MFELFKTLGWKKFFLSETIPLALAILFSEAAYKFGSFVLECLAFLATWFILSWIKTYLHSRSTPR